MLLKVLIILLFAAVVFSLFGGLKFLVSDLGDNHKKRLLYALGIRITLAALLMAAIFYGAYTGQISSQAPWDKKLHPEATTVIPKQP